MGSSNSLWNVKVDCYGYKLATRILTLSRGRTADGAVGEPDIKGIEVGGWIVGAIREIRIPSL